VGPALRERRASLGPVDVELALGEQPGAVELDKRVVISKGRDHQLALAAVGEQVVSQAVALAGCSVAGSAWRVTRSSPWPRSTRSTDLEGQSAPSQRIAAKVIEPREERHVGHCASLRGITNDDEAGKRVREGFVPLISGHRGFVAYYFVDAGDGVMVSTSVFEDQADEEESNALAADFVKANLADLFPNPPMITAGHVVAQH
jgi:hypothetical protein